MSSAAWKPEDHANATLIRTRLQSGPANRNQLADLVGDVIKLGLALCLLRELGEIESNPPLDTPEHRRRPRIYSLRAAARLEPVAAPFADAPYEGEDEHEDAGIPEVPEDVPGIAALGAVLQALEAAFAPARVERHRLVRGASAAA